MAGATLLSREPQAVGFPFNACRSSVLMASGRVQGSFEIQASRADKSSGCRRTPISVPFPVAGGPLFFCVITV
jgi:hypothetical protein